MVTNNFGRQCCRMTIDSARSASPSPNRSPTEAAEPLVMPPDGEPSQALSGLGRNAEALPLHQRALRIYEASLGPDHPYVGWCREAIETIERSL
jgi:hypothetical protein